MNIFCIINRSNFITTVLSVSFFFAIFAAFTQARVQVIHNSADSTAEVVDVWLDDVRLIDNFKLHTATPFIDAPSGVDCVISITGPNSTAPTPAVAHFDYYLEDGMTYIIVANGMVSPEGYDPLQPFDLYVSAMGREMAADSKNTDILVFRDTTIAPIVDTHEVLISAGKVVDDLDCGTYADYLELPTSDYSIQVRDMYGSMTVSQYATQLSDLGLEGQSITLLPSGLYIPKVQAENDMVTKKVKVVR
jgi:hypothetical protein